MRWPVARHRSRSGRGPEGEGITWLGDAEAADPARVGGKTAGLSRLASGRPVPPGFCLTADAYRRAIGDAGTDRGALLAWVGEAVAPAYRELAARAGRRRPRVAVRSSALDEDGTEASFAGQHDTVLNVAGARGVADAVVRCWESAASERARAYRDAHGLGGATAVAVLVQELVPADVAAVVFSADPVTGDRDEVVINASWGLGQAVVAGSVTPDTYRLSRDPLRLVFREVADKRVMTARRRHGTREVPVPRRRRAAAALTPEQCLELGRLAVELEEETGRPVDIECAYERGRLHVLQCRPITAVDPPSRRRPRRDTDGEAQAR